jgi:hypothetical protein
MEEKKADKKTHHENTLPPYPEGILEWSDDEKKMLLYTGDKDDTLARLRHKTWHLWLLYAGLRNNQRLIDVVNKDEELDKTSDEFFIRLVLVTAIDRLGKILNSGVEIAEEFMSGGHPHNPPEAPEPPTDP